MSSNPRKNKKEAKNEIKKAIAQKKYAKRKLIKVGVGHD